MTSDGKPYGPIRFESLIQERYLISKRTNTSYLDTGKMTPRERTTIVKYILEEIKKENESLQSLSNKG